MAAEAKSLTPKGFKTVMDIDAQGTFNMCSAVHPAMAKNVMAVVEEEEQSPTYGRCLMRQHGTKLILLLQRVLLIL